MIAVSRVTVNHDGRGGTAPDHLVWHQGSKKKQRKVDIGVDIGVNIDLASLPGPPGFLHGPWVQVHGGCISGADIAAWPYSVTLPCKLVAFLGSLHWPADSGDLGHFVVSYLEVFILFEQWAGHLLLSEKVTRPHERGHRLLFLCQKESKLGRDVASSVALVKALGKLPGGLGRFLPCSVGRHMSRIRHLGWDQCSHRLTSSNWKADIISAFRWSVGVLE